MYGCQQNLITANSELKAVLEFICSESHKLTNCGIYYARQLYFKTRKIIGKFDLQKEYKTNKHFQVLYSQAAQQILRSVAESFKSFQELNKKYKKGELKDKPMLPKYRKKGGLALVTYPKQALKLVDNQISIPLGKTVKRWFGIDSFSLLMPSNLKFEDIKELRILPRNQCFYVEFVYEHKPVVKHEVDWDKALSIDPGIGNWLSCITNTGLAFIVDGRKVKSLNQWYNKRISKLKEGKPQGYWERQLAHITEKRNRQMRDAVNKAAKIVINYCLNNKIGTVVFGWNQGQRQEAKLGKLTQTFVQIPTAKVKERIKQLCELYDLRFIETEESYTSKSSFLDNDFLPSFGEDNKPKGWKPSGKRIFRGLYKTKAGKLINSDLMGAANIMKKVEVQLGLDLTKACRALLLTAPPRYLIWDSKKKKRYATSIYKGLCGEVASPLYTPCHVA
ncbi:RNA-guided endonuclease InsQ/TnpB family protein [Gloeothece verrucosa]|uniref:Transposase, IS605 OrfB family n=1 Tax=Gloeothece verrucosa (strain PCC 7822) TaxID=497965 RepID=E0UKH5_GLOV7|nr:RNA-guided endonuclease TnpB family protein [Gloeothece verrucosa]ADN17056.1 transposase, IS605 OrfB family [Gloeothece verrucosa PCC 7822]